MELALQEQKRANEDLKQELKDQDELIGKSKGQLISKCPFRVIVWTKIPMNFFPGYLPQPLKRGQIKKVV